MRLPVTILLLAMAGSARTSAQVGHDPARSPYRTLRYGQFIGITGGWFGGSGGDLEVAPHRGRVLGIRYDVFANGKISLALAATRAGLTRTIIDPSQPIATARTDTVSQTTWIGEAILQFNVTGGKTWNRLAPFVSAGLGFALASRTPEDESGFGFRGKFALTPGIGTRIYLAEQVYLRLEARNLFWQVNYPGSFRTPPSTAPSEPPVLAAPVKEWLSNGWYSVGLSVAFRRPF
jgi:hypothetical protein